MFANNSLLLIHRARSKTIWKPWLWVSRISLLDLHWYVYEGSVSEERTITKDVTGPVVYALRYMWERSKFHVARKHLMFLDVTYFASSFKCISNIEIWQDEQKNIPGFDITPPLVFSIIHLNKIYPKEKRSEQWTLLLCDILNISSL